MPMHMGHHGRSLRAALRFFCELQARMDARQKGLRRVVRHGRRRATQHIANHLVGMPVGAQLGAVVVIGQQGIQLVCTDLTIGQRRQCTRLIAIPTGMKRHTGPRRMAHVHVVLFGIHG